VRAQPPRSRYAVSGTDEPAEAGPGSPVLADPGSRLAVGDREAYLGEISSTPFYMGPDQYADWSHTHLTVDIVPGRGNGFSVEAPEGVRFLIRSRLLTEHEIANLPPIETGPHH
jgi:uncharacterized protein